MGLISQAQQELPKEPMPPSNTVGINPSTGETITPVQPKMVPLDDPIETQPGFADDGLGNPPEDGPNQLPTTGPGDGTMTTGDNPPAETGTTTPDGGLNTVDTFSQLDPNPGAATGNNIDPSEGRNNQYDSVSGQANMINQGLIDILNQNNPLFAMQAARGRRGANARGLGQSSFSERAAQGAIYDVALPMVQQASQQAQAFEQMYRNQDFQGRLAMEQLARQQDFASRQAQLDRALQETMQGRDIDYRQWLQNTTQEHEVLITRNQQAMDAYRTFQEAAMQILSNPESTPEQKEAGMAALREGLAGSLNMLQGLTNTDLSAYLPEGWRPTGGGVLPGGPTTGPGPGEPGGLPVIPGGGITQPGTGPGGVNDPQNAVSEYLRETALLGQQPDYTSYVTWAQRNTPGQILDIQPWQLIMQDGLRQQDLTQQG